MIGRAALTAFTVLAAGAVLAPKPGHAEGTVVEREKTYAITGGSGAELYMSIGEHGPKVGAARVIAHTSFDLKWSRDYRPEAGGCRLVSARPSLVITYTLPRPKHPLSPQVTKRWDAFIDGIRRHEKVHGETIKAMVQTIEAESVGMFVADDPQCKEIRKQLTSRLAAISLAQREQGRAFDRVEMGQGGAVQTLILNLVNP